MITPFAQPSSSHTPDLSSFQRAVIFVSDVLMSLAAVEKKIGFNALHKKLNTFLGKPISLQRFEEVLHAVNRQSWRQHQCLVTAVVLGQGGKLGAKFFLCANQLGAIPEFPLSDYDRHYYTGRLQYQLFAVAKSMSNKN